MGTTVNGIGVYGGSSGSGLAALFSGNVQLTGKVTSYNNTPTLANGVPSIVFQLNIQSGGSGIPFQDLFTPSSDGIFRITAFQECLATSGGITYFSTGFAWTLPTGGRSGDSIPSTRSSNCSVLTGVGGSIVTHVKGGTPIEYIYSGMDVPFQVTVLIEQLL